tara:strand:- start:19762 stop:20229 length:468 start_codon:yes stop_codon:yes gene_type:complete
MWRDLLKADFVVKTNYPEADFWLQKRGSEQNVGKPMRKFSKIQGQYNIGIKVPEGMNKEYVYAQLAALFRKGYWQSHSHGTLNLQHIRVDEVKKILESFEDKADYKDVTSDKIEKIYDDWLKRSREISKILMSSNSLIREGREIKRFLQKMEDIR